MNIEESIRGPILTAYDCHGGVVRLLPEDEPRIDAAVSTYLDTKRDSIIHCSLIEGGTYHMLASTVSSWFVSTPETRRNTVLMDKLQSEEHEEYRRDIGVQAWDE